MSYVTPVTNRTQAAPGYWNVADWTRVYGNSNIVRNLTAIMLDTPIAFNFLSLSLSITSFPQMSDFNTMLGNIEAVRLAVAGESIPGTETEIKDDWIAGLKNTQWDWEDVNLWESTLDVIWQYYGGPDLEVCPTLTEDLTITDGNHVIYIDCLNMDGYNVTLEGSAQLYII
jgi:hypothetical protein